MKVGKSIILGGVLAVLCVFGLKNNFAHAGSISISNDSSISLTNTDGTATGTTNINIIGEQIKNYQLYLSSSTAETGMVGSTGNSDVIISTPSSTTLAALNPNTWGYCVALYSACASFNYYQPIRSNTNPAEIASVSDLSLSSYSVNDTITVSFAAKVDNDILADSYTSTQLISVTAEEKAYFDSISYMQEMTKSVCDAEPTPSPSDIAVPTKRLIDSRDGKYYWVSKLADGNCWMTQDLKLDLSKTVALTPADSDVSANWTPANSTTTTLRTNNTSDTSVQSFSIGSYVMNWPANGTNLCTSYVGAITSCSGFSQLTNVSSGFTDNYESSANGLSTLSLDTSVGNKRYDAHYLIGNYYTWNAATAGSGISLANDDATDSICPKGWHLPTINNTDSGSYGYLMNVYSLTSSQEDRIKLSTAPFYMNMNGYISPYGSDGIRMVGMYGYYATSSAHSNTSLDRPFGIGASYFHVPTQNSRYVGETVRCVANFETTIDDISYMQEMTAEVCTNTRTPSASETTTVPTKQLIDSRDGKKYWIAKLADGNCWMTQNLALDLSTSTTLTPEDSDVRENWTPDSSTTSTIITGTANYQDVQSFTVGDHVINTPNAGTSLCTNVNGITNCSGYSGLTDVSSGYTDNYVATGSGSALQAVDNASTSYDAHYLLGNYYTYRAATAASAPTDNISAVTDASSSICPKGWKLPSGSSNDNGSYYNLLTIYGVSNSAASVNQMGSAPLYLYRGGYNYPLTGNGYNLVGERGFYWTGGAGQNAGYAIRLYFEGASVSAANSYYRNLANSVRCIANDYESEDFGDVEYMQDMTSEICSSIRTPSALETTTVPTKRLTDRRDGNTYWVAKLADGNCWMTQNLDFDLDTSVTLTPDDTDVSANWTPSASTTTTPRTGDVSVDAVQSFDLGKYVIRYPNTTTNLCSSWSTSFANCSGSANLIEVSSWNDTYINTGTGTGTQSIIGDHGVYDAHYLVGNYYTWNAATAETGTSMASGEAQDSICPKNWSLPTGGNSSNGTYGYLMNLYGVTASNMSKLGVAPFYIVRSGYVDPGASAGLYEVGIHALYRSSTASTAIYSRIFAANTSFNVSNNNLKYRGFSVRCMITTD